MARTKKLKLLVDNLQHISDHGLKVEFEKPELKAWVDSMRQDGEYKFTVGRSWLKVQTLGHMTFTEFCHSGNHAYTKAHYLDQAAGLSMTASSAEEVQVLRYVTLKSDKSPAVYSGMYNLGQARHSRRIDEAKTWLKESGWCLFGQHGMRAKAQANRLAAQAKDVFNTRARIASLQQAAKAQEVSTATLWKNSRKEHRSRYNSLVESAACYRLFAELYPDVESLPQELQVFSMSLYKSYNELYRLLHKFRGDGVIVIKGHDQRYTPELVRPNYAVKRQDGVIRLSSGMRCDLKEEEVLAWLRGERDAPRSTYGPCSRVLTRTEPPDPEPRVLLQCGCHVVDVARDLGEPYSSLLAPQHEVKLQDAVPDLRWRVEDKPLIWQHLADVCSRNLEYIAAEKRALMASLRDIKASLPQRSTECAAQREALLDQEILVLKQLQEQEQELQRMEVSESGATLNQLLQMAAHVVNTLLPMPMEVPK